MDIMTNSDKFPTRSREIFKLLHPIVHEAVCVIWNRLQHEVKPKTTGEGFQAAANILLRVNVEVINLYLKNTDFPVDKKIRAGLEFLDVLKQGASELIEALRGDLMHVITEKEVH